ncbi:MAG: DNA polymerase III subunit gamma/tau [Clostridia bacterium]|nr:DNA polymerase III subunit gamma/tau [Clostridia bacterium]
MSYRALYRQYRPATFGEMIGQDHITTILKNQVQSGQTAHAYLFAGTRGTGKTSAARILARAVNCISPLDGEPCGVCDACRRTAGECADIIELDAASNSSVDNIRDIIEKAAFMPLELKRKVYIIDEAHALSDKAVQALLKTLEEPPAHVMFILATTEVPKIPATIISRCQRMDFHRLSVSDMVRRMEEILLQVGAEIEKEGMLAIARAAEGGMRDCLSLADQCLSFCGNYVSKEDVYGVLGSMEEGFLFEMSEALMAADPARTLRLVDRVVNDGRDLKVFLHDMTLHMRALLITKLCGHCSDILDCTEDAMARYQQQAEGAGEMRLLRANELLLQAEAKLKSVTSPRALIESTLVRIARPEEKRTLDDILERVEKLEREVKDAARPAPVYKAEPEEPPMPPVPDLDAAPPFNGDMEPPFDPDPPKAAPAKKPAPAPVSAPAPEQPRAARVPSGDPKAMWDAIVKKLSETDQPLGVMARFGKAAGIENGVLTVRYDKEIMYRALTEQKGADKLNAAAAEAAPGYTVHLVMGGQASLEDMGRELFGSKFRTMD